MPKCAQVSASAEGPTTAMAIVVVVLVVLLEIVNSLYEPHIQGTVTDDASVSSSGLIEGRTG
jgi:hypothetical protein